MWRSLENKGGDCTMIHDGEVDNEAALAFVS